MREYDDSDDFHVVGYIFNFFISLSGMCLDGPTSASVQIKHKNLKFINFISYNM